MVVFCVTKSDYDYVINHLNYCVSKSWDLADQNNKDLSLKWYEEADVFLKCLKMLDLVSDKFVSDAHAEFNELLDKICGGSHEK